MEWLLPLKRAERSQEPVRSRPPPVGIKLQQMPVAPNAAEQLEVRAAPGCRERFVITADQGFVIEAVVVRIEPELRHLVRRAANQGDQSGDDDCEWMKGDVPALRVESAD